MNSKQRKLHVEDKNAYVHLNGVWYDTVRITATMTKFTVTVTDSTGKAPELVTKWRWKDWDWCDEPWSMIGVHQKAIEVLDLFKHPPRRVPSKLKLE